MEHFPWDRYTFLTMSIERPRPELVAALTEHGYIYMCTHGQFGDNFYVHKSLPNLEQVKAKFSRPNGGQCR